MKRTENPAFITKLGTTKRAGPRSRLWLEGNRLMSNAFYFGNRLRREWHDDENYLVLTVVDEATWQALPPDQRGSVSGSVSRPVIDITGAKVAATFRTERVAVLFGARGGRAVISEVY